MKKTVICLPDGQQISSGPDTVRAIAGVELTQWVNDGSELAPGACCAAMVELKLIDPGEVPAIEEGAEFALYTQEEDGTLIPVGLFIAQQPTRPGPNTLQVTAYDRISLLDRDLTQWLAALEGWPYSVYALADMVCTACGLELVSGELPNGAYPVEKFLAQGITGRQLLQWIGQICGRFCRATPLGQVEFAWYRENQTLGIGPEAQADSIPYFQGQLSYESYTVAPVEKVRLCRTEEDVGTVYPETVRSGNTYTVCANPLLTPSSPEALTHIAQSLYELLRECSYTPCRVEIPMNDELGPGQILRITAPGGRQWKAWIMTRVRKGRRDILECTGSPRRDSSAAVNHLSYQSLTGKLLNLQTDVDGLRAENQDAAGKTSLLELTVDGIRTQITTQQTDVQHLKESVTAVEQTADALQIRIGELQQEGAAKVKTGKAYTFDDSGLRICGDQGMENRLDETGMYVTRSGEVMLQATNAGVIATDVSVRNYLVVGEHARLETYGDGTDTTRTACFYLEG